MFSCAKRYDDAYQAQGFEGLKPRDRLPRNSGDLPENFEELLQEAIQLRREVPSRSVEKIITILEMEGRVSPCIWPPSTADEAVFHGQSGPCYAAEGR